MLVPADSPVTVVTVVPVVTDTPAVLVQAPPGVKSLRVMDKPLHTEDTPPIPVGTGLTVTTATAGTPATVYEITVVPVVTPVTMPNAFTTATTPLAVLHTPPAVVSVSETVEPVQTLVRPPIDPTEETVTVTIVVAKTVPQLLLTV